MKPPRFSIARLMVVVGVVAFNFAAVQFWSHSSSPSLLTGRFLTSLALQAGLFCLIRSRGTRFFSFWAGFEVFGLAAAITTIYMDFFTAEDSLLFRQWDEYLFSAYNFIERLCTLIKDPYYQSRAKTILLLQNGSFTSDFLYEFISFLPQFLVALVGGFLTGLTVRIWGGRRASVAIGPAAE